MSPVEADLEAGCDEKAAADAHAAELSALLVEADIDIESPRVVRRSRRIRRRLTTYDRDHT